MSPVEDFIRQARSAGKSDELIRQELASSGWQEADISQAMGANVAPAGATPAVATGSTPVATTVASGVSATTATVAKVGMSGLLKAIISIVVIVGGAIGGYVIFSKIGTSGNGTPVKSIPGFSLDSETLGKGGQTVPDGGAANGGTTPTNTNQQSPTSPSTGNGQTVPGGGASGTSTTTPPPATNTSRAFTGKCSDVLTNADIQRFTGDSSAVTLEENHNAGDLGCVYTQFYQDGSERPKHAFSLGFVLPNAGETTTQIYETSRSIWLGMYNQAKADGTSLGTAPQDIQGIGAKAWFGPIGPADGILVLSSKQKYVFTIAGFYEGDSAFTKGMAKVVDMNLNKY